MVFRVVALLAELLCDAVLGLLAPRAERLVRIELDQRELLAVFGRVGADAPEAGHRRHDLEQLPDALAVLLLVDARIESVAERDDDHRFLRGWGRSVDVAGERRVTGPATDRRRAAPPSPRTRPCRRRSARGRPSRSAR